jgi:hypothetical protein
MVANRLFLVSAALCAAAGIIIVLKNPDRLAVALIFVGPAVLFGALAFRGRRSGAP